MWGLQAQRTIVAALAGFGVTTGVAASAGLMGGLGLLEGAAGVEQVGKQNPKTAPTQLTDRIALDKPPSCPQPLPRHIDRHSSTH